MYVCRYVCIYTHVYIMIIIVGISSHIHTQICVSSHIHTQLCVPYSIKPLGSSPHTTMLALCMCACVHVCMCGLLCEYAKTRVYDS